MNLFVIGISVGIELRCQRSCRLAEEDKGGAEVGQRCRRSPGTGWACPEGNTMTHCSKNRVDKSEALRPGGEQCAGAVCINQRMRRAALLSCFKVLLQGTSSLASGSPLSSGVAWVSLDRGLPSCHGWSSQKERSYAYWWGPFEGVEESGRGPGC